ncbi:MAG: hypothetical protein ALAOOOJD_03967 [bacterium]|nr:hypothetical protein [bacterium]
MITHRQQRDKQGNDTGQKKHAGAQLDAVGEVVEPAAHRQISHGRGDDEAERNEFGEIPGQQRDDAGNGGPEHFADTNFFRALFRRERGHAEQSQAADEDRQYGEIAHDFPELRFKFVKLIEPVIEKRKFHGALRLELRPDFLNLAHGMGEIAGA